MSTPLAAVSLLLAVPAGGQHEPPEGRVVAVQRVGEGGGVLLGPRRPARCRGRSTCGPNGVGVMPHESKLHDARDVYTVHVDGATAVVGVYVDAGVVL